MFIRPWLRNQKSRDQRSLRLQEPQVPCQALGTVRERGPGSRAEAGESTAELMLLSTALSAAIPKDTPQSQPRTKCVIPGLKRTQKLSATGTVGRIQDA